MNIIAGRAKGRKLLTLPGVVTRPTQAKVRAALFSSLMAWVPGASWIDLFAGSGAIGLEAASRGAIRVVLVENASLALQVIRQNIALTQLPGVEIQTADVLAALERLQGQRFDVVFMDPPYEDDPLPVVEALASRDLLAPHGRVVVEHRRDRPMPETVGRLHRLRTSHYAGTSLSYFAWAEPTP